MIIAEISGGISNSISPVITSGTTINSLCTNIGIQLPEQIILDFNLYPNPAQQSFTIELPQHQNVNLRIYDVTGRKIYQRTNITDTVNIDCSSFTSGIYFVQAVNGNSILSCRLIKE